MEKKEHTVIDAINEIVGWYQCLPSGYNHIHDLMYNRDQLSGYFYTLCTEVGNLRREWNRAQATRENEKLKFQHKQMVKGDSYQKADVLARLNTSKEYELEKDAEGIYYGYRECIDAVKEVLQAMNQRIAHARAEWEQMQFTKRSST